MSFHQFARLPQELQDAVWAEAAELPSAYLLRLVRKQKPTARSITARCTTLERIATPCALPLLVPFPEPPPPPRPIPQPMAQVLLWTCRASRAVAISYHKRRCVPPEPFESEDTKAAAAAAAAADEGREVPGRGSGGTTRLQMMPATGDVDVGDVMQPRRRQKQQREEEPERIRRQRWPPPLLLDTESNLVVIEAPPFWDQWMAYHASRGDRGPWRVDAQASPSRFVCHLAVPWDRLGNGGQRRAFLAVRGIMQVFIGLRSLFLIVSPPGQSGQEQVQGQWQGQWLGPDGSRLRISDEDYEKLVDGYFGSRQVSKSLSYYCEGREYFELADREQFRGALSGTLGDVLTIMSAFYYPSKEKFELDNKMSFRLMSYRAL